MKTKHINMNIAAVAFAAGLALTAGHAQAQGAAPTEWAKGRLIVMQRAGLAQAELDKVLKPHGGKSRRIGNSNLHVVELPTGGSETSVVRLLQKHPLLKFAELDYKVRRAMQPNDPYVGSEWHLAMIKAQGAWDKVTGTGVTIAILDTGVLSTHPDLAANIVPGWNAFDNNSQTADVEGHGTETAGTAAAVLNNGTGVAGVAGGAKIMPIRVTDAAAIGYYSTIASGVTYAADHGARIASVSLAPLFSSSTVASAGEYLKSKGGLLVVGAGNSGTDQNWPSVTSMIVVSATDGSDSRASWSSYGGMVSVAAPGVGIWTTSLDGGYRSVNGTSYSTPATAGVLALIMAANPLLTASQVENVLYSSAVDLGTPGRDIYFGYGRVDADAAVRLAISTTAADSQKPTVAIAAPVGNASVTGVVPIDVSASDNVGVARVELRVNGVVVASDAVAPYQFAWDSSALSGNVTLTAVAYDGAGNSQVSAGVTVNATNTVIGGDTTPPSITISNPKDGSDVTGTLQIRVTAGDNSGAAQLKESLFIDGVQVASATGGSLNYAWNTRKAALGMHSISAVAVDAAGNRTTKTIQVRRVK